MRSAFSYLRTWACALLSTSEPVMSPAQAIKSQHAPMLSACAEDVCAHDSNTPGNCGICYTVNM